MVAVAIGRERVNHARMPRAGEKGPTLHTTPQPHCNYHLFFRPGTSSNADLALLYNVNVTFLIQSLSSNDAAGSPT